MLGRLFGNPASSLNSVSHPRDSVVDEEYTRGLLYPNHTASQNAPTHVPPVGAARVGDFDDWSGLELDPSKNLRIIIAQDALGDSEEPCILFDTNPIPRSESLTDLVQHTGSLQNPTHRRAGSTALTVKVPTSPLISKPTPRLAPNSPSMPFPIRNRSSTFSGASDEHDPRHIRAPDFKEQTRNILNCAFGSSSCASFGTKMHVLSLGLSAREPIVTPTSPGNAGNVSTGYFRKREPITRTHSAALPGVRSAMYERSHSSSAAPLLKLTDAVLITKLFSVNLPEPTDQQKSYPSPTSQEGEATHDRAEHNLRSPATKKKKPRAKKTPVFAIILVVQLPNNPSTSSRPPSRGICPVPPTYPSPRSFRSSFNSRSSSPRFVTPNPLPDHGDPRVNALVEHWDIIDRVLALLENTSAPKILSQLKKVDNLSEAVVSKPPKPKEKTMQRTNQINIYLHPLALNSDASLKESAVQAVQRIQRALRIPRVTIGQGRWGLWNDELIRIARYNGGKEQSLFISNLLTSFLAMHTSDWVTLLEPSWYNRRQYVSRRLNDPSIITARTVVVSNDRSIARRFIFLLSSFLGSNLAPGDGGAFCKGSDPSIPLHPTLLSPSMEVSTTTQHSRFAERHQSHGPDHPQGGLLASRGLRRRPSDIYSIKSIPIPASDLTVRKSSAATASTVTPNPTNPVPRFSSSSGPEAGSLSDGSSASASLTKIWQNNYRDSDSSTASTKWGSLLSGFWSKDSSTSASQSTAASVSSSSVRLRKEAPLDTMVRQLGMDEDPTVFTPANEFNRSIESSPSPAMPLNLQVNADEGIIDVDIEIPGFLSSSNDSRLASPPVRNVRHVSSAASFESLASPKRHFSPGGGSKVQSRVAGFLPRFHPDYSLQAVNASKADFPDMMEKIKSAMLSEPYSREPTVSGWVDVCTTLVANLSSASIKRIRLRRQVPRLNRHADDSHQPETLTMDHCTAPRPIIRSSTAGSECAGVESFSYDTATNHDPLLMDAIDCILARDSSDGPTGISAAPFTHSRQTSSGTIESHKRSNKQFTFENPRFPDDLSRGMSESLVIGALENIVRSVERDLSNGRNERHFGTHPNERSAAQIRSAQGNALREGVRSWLLKEEHTAVW